MKSICTTSWRYGAHSLRMQTQGWADSRFARLCLQLRNKYKDVFAEKTGAKLGFMSAFVKASTVALRAFPDVNSSMDGKDLVYHDYCDVSVAVATPTGLVVPVLRNAESMSMAGVEAAIAALGDKARKVGVKLWGVMGPSPHAHSHACGVLFLLLQNQIAIEDMTGGTFTISNGGTSRPIGSCKRR
jgi:2-oxoglutarate dehydrogenase E2 component (dihydrolipoamide succinyltransferase)